MGILDRFRTPRPRPNAQRGGSGRQHSAGFLDYDERNARLTGRRGLDTFEEMWRTDGDCRRALLAIIVATVGGTWTVDPPGTDQEPTTPDEQEATDLLTWALFDPAGMSPQLPGHLMQAGRVAGRSGHAPFEQIWKVAEWRGRQVITLKTLDLRRPQSIQRWMQDGPDLTGIEQWTPGARSSSDTGSPGPVEIPASDLVYYRFGAEGDNWEGESLLRPAYKHWWAKTGLEIMQMQALERSGKGIPSGYPPATTNPDELDAFAEFLAAVGSDDAGYWLAPGPHAQFAEKGQGWYWEFVTPKDAKGAADAFKVALDYQSDKIAAAVLEEFMRQGMSRVGTNATAETQQNPFLQMCEALASTVFEAPLNEQLIPRILALNFTGLERLPRLRCSLIDETTLEELAAYVSQLSSAGALRPEPTLEAFLRRRADLPPADEDAIAEQEQAKADRERKMLEAKASAARAGADPDEAGDQPPPAKKAARILARQDRELRDFETHISLDRIESTIDGARDRFQLAAGPHVRALAAELAAQVAAGRDLAPGRAPQPLADAIETELEHLYQQGRLSVREELASQGHAEAMLLAVDPVARARRFANRARAAADAIRALIVLALNRRRTVTGDVAQLTVEAERAGAAAVREEAYTHASAVVNTGRSDQADQMADLIAGSRYTSILDGNRCSHCARADDDALRPLTDPVRLARRPPNPSCEGGHRCRCIEAFQLKTEAPASLRRADPFDAAGGLTHRLEYNPNQPRDEHGRWARGGLGRIIRRATDRWGREIRIHAVTDRKIRSAPGRDPLTPDVVATAIENATHRLPGRPGQERLVAAQIGPSRYLLIVIESDGDGWRVVTVHPSRRLPRS